MPIKKSAGAVIFRLQPTHHPPAPRASGEGKIFYLLLHYPSSAKAPRDYWDFPKGHIEKGEKELDTVRREVEEETGLKDFEFVKGFKEWIKYFFKFRGKTVFKIVTFNLVEAKKEKVKISREHLGFKWLPYKEALEQLTFKNTKEILKKAHQFLLQDNPHRKGVGENRRHRRCRRKKPRVGAHSERSEEWEDGRAGCSLKSEPETST